MSTQTIFPTFAQLGLIPYIMYGEGRHGKELVDSFSTAQSSVLFSFSTTGNYVERNRPWQEGNQTRA